MWRYVTTPIYYANARPHIGHLYTTVFADTYSRWMRSTGAEVIFTTGMDEHGLKIQRSAAGMGITPKEFCDGTAARFKELFSRMHIDYTRFYRTTDSNPHSVSHKEAVWSLWRRMESAGFIYKDKHEGWYCSAEERFIQRNQLVSTRDGRLVTANKYPVEWVQEENYFFRMDELKSQVEEWIMSSALDGGLREQSLKDLKESGPISISRPKSRVHWGIPVPGDEHHTIHVWLDALTSYIAAVGFPDSDLSTNQFWLNSFHVLGMEISRFHSVHLPAFLLAAGLPPPARLKVHSHWLNRSIKMSKSLGNAVDPEVLIKFAGAEALRFYLLYKGPQNLSDAEFTFEDFSKVVNYLGDRFGNLVARITSPKVMRTSLLTIVELQGPGTYSQAEDDLFAQVSTHLSTLSTENPSTKTTAKPTFSKQWLH